MKQNINPLHILTKILFLTGILIIPYSFHSFVESSERYVEPLWSYPVGADKIDITPSGEFVVLGHGDVYLFDKDGNKIWVKENLGSRLGCISDDGKYVASEVWNRENRKWGAVVLLDENGEEIWRYETGNVSALVMTPDASYIVASGSFKDRQINGVVYMFDREGEKLWDYEVEGKVLSISVSRDGDYVAVGSNDGRLYFFDKEGELLWDYNAGSDVGAVTITLDNHVVALSSYLCFFDKDGNVIWSFDVPNTSYFNEELAITPDGERIVVGINYLLLFDRNGNLLWNTGNIITDTVSISSNGDYIATEKLRMGLSPIPQSISISIFDKEGNELWNYDVRDNILSTAISEDGRYVAVSAGNGYTSFFDNFKAMEEYKENKKEIPYIKSSYFYFSMLIFILFSLLFFHPKLKKYLEVENQSFTEKEEKEMIFSELLKNFETTENLRQKLEGHLNREIPDLTEVTLEELKEFQEMEKNR
ncbi:MAG: WD40 repeat domain-containing protein [Candidatus Methanofastidiosia archaeon]